MDDFNNVTEPSINKPEEQKSALENTELHYQLQEAVIKSFNDYSAIVFKAKYKTNHGKGILGMAARATPVACLAKVSSHTNLKILTPKQMLQRLPIELAQVKAVIHLKTY